MDSINNEDQLYLHLLSSGNLSSNEILAVAQLAQLVEHEALNLRIVGLSPSPRKN